MQKPGYGFAIAARAGPISPSGAEELKVHIAVVTIEGGLPAVARDAERLKAALSGETVTAADLFAAANRL